jgi:hypothetical protein
MGFNSAFKGLMCLVVNSSGSNFVTLLFFEPLLHGPFTIASLKHLCSLTTFWLRNLTTHPDILSHVNIVRPDDRDPKFKIYNSKPI